MPRLIWVFAGHTGHFVGFVMLWLWRDCSPEPSLVAYVISTIISWAGSFQLSVVMVFILMQCVTQVPNSQKKCLAIARLMSVRLFLDLSLRFWQFYRNWVTEWQNQQNDIHSGQTLISLGFHHVWSESSLGTLWVAKDPRLLHADSIGQKLWSDFYLPFLMPHLLGNG